MRHRSNDMCKFLDQSFAITSGAPVVADRDVRQIGSVHLNPSGTFLYSTKQLLPEKLDRSFRQIRERHFFE